MECHGATSSTERAVIGACPLDCPDGCSWVVTVSDDQPVKLRGNPKHPFTAGGLCRKVYRWLDYAGDPSRLLTPLRRVSPKGPTADTRARVAAFESITWDEAMSEIAWRFDRIIDEHGPAAIWPFVGTGNMGYLQGASTPVGSRLWNHLGVSDHDLTICSPSGHHGLSYTLGISAGMDPEDVVDAGLVLIWGANTLISGQHWWPFVERARANGAAIVVVDPIRTRTAERADLHVPLAVGSDTVLALGLANALIESGAVDASFIDRSTLGFDDFADSAQEWTAERVCNICDLDPAVWDGLVELLVTKSPLAVKFGHGAQRHAGGGQSARTVSCLAALTGSFDRPGGGLFYSTGPRYGLDTAAAGGARPGARPRSLAMTNLVANLEAADPSVEALFIHGANPVVSNPDTNGVRRALGRQGLFNVVAELFPTETVDYADIVLPSTMAHEHLDLNDSFAHYYLNLNQPAVAAPGQCLSHTEMFRRLAAAMKLSDPSLFATDDELLDALLGADDYRQAGVTAETLRVEGFVRIPGVSAPFRAFTGGFPTPSGRFEFASDRAAADGHGRLPHVHLGDEAGTADGEHGAYDLVAAAGDRHVNSTFAGTDVVGAWGVDPTLEIHPVDAARDHLATGDAVRVHNERGSFEAVIEISERPRRGVAMCAKGTWGMALNATIVERDSDMGRGAIFHDNRVWVEAAGSGASPAQG